MRVVTSVSVLIPTYNSARYIAETLNCVLSQTRAATEVIVVDDGSVDETKDIVSGFAKCGVRLIAQGNAGAGAARNRALLTSTSSHVIFLDADDLISSSHIEALSDAVVSDRDVAFAQWDRFYHSPQEAQFPYRPTYVSLPGPDWVVTDWQMVNMTQCGMFLLPRCLLNEFGGWKERLSRGPNDDFEFFARILVRAHALRFAPGARLYYRSGVRGSLSRRGDRTAVEAKLKSLYYGTNHLLAVSSTEAVRSVCADRFQAFIYEQYPWHRDLTRVAHRRVQSLGGSCLLASGPPGFEQLRPWVGWRLARHVQIVAEGWHFNSVGRQGR